MSRLPSRRLLVGTSLLLALALFLFVAAGIVGPDSWVYREEFQKSRLLIDRIEDFRERHGRVPEDHEAYVIMDSLGWPRSEECPCYHKRGADSYIVYFGVRTVGSSLVYDSTTGEWQEEG